MPAAGYTPISLYYSTTGAAVPVNTSLVNGELAINITDGKLFYKDNGGTVQTLATKATAALTVPITPANGGTGVANGSNNTITFTGNYTFGATLSGNTSVTFPTSGSLGYLNIPAIADKTASYTIATTDIGKVVGVGTGGSITIPNSTFAAGDAVLVFNNTSAGITITCNTTTAYIAGTDSTKASVTLATRGVANILFISATACVITGNVS